MYGKVFLASHKVALAAAAPPPPFSHKVGNLAVKIVMSRPDSDLIPPSLEVVLARRFAREGAGFKPRSPLRGFEPTRLFRDNLIQLMRGPDPPHPASLALHTALGWFAMEPFDMTLMTYLRREIRVLTAEPTNPDDPEEVEEVRSHRFRVMTSFNSANRALGSLMNLTWDKGLVHADLHTGNLGIRTLRQHGGDAPLTQDRRPGEVKLCDYSRSFTVHEAELAREDLNESLRLTPAQAVKISWINDVATLLSSCLWDMRTSNATDHSSIATRGLVEHLTVSTQLQRRLEQSIGIARAASQKNPNQIAAVLDMLTSLKALKRLLETNLPNRVGDGALGTRSEFDEIIRVLRNVYPGTYCIVDTIYRAGSPAFQGHDWPALIFPPHTV